VSSPFLDQRGSAHTGDASRRHRVCHDIANPANPWVFPPKAWVAPECQTGKSAVGRDETASRKAKVMTQNAALSVTGQVERQDEVLTPEALEFVAELQRRFGETRNHLLRQRQERRAEIARTGRLDFLDETRDVREDPDWRVAPAPPALTDRRVEITGPTERKMLVNALNSGARVFMADFEDSNSPTWANMVVGHANLTDAIERRIDFTSDEGKEYRLGEKVATLVVRPRGWHLDERHLQLDGTPIAGAFMDFGLYFFHNAKRLLDKGAGPYFYLPKMESHLEARLWNDIFTFAQDALGVPYGTIRATVLVETITAAFEMEEILYELRDHASGCNAGRWDYIFSVIKTFRDRGAEFLLPDRNAVTMTVPFMRAYTELLVKTCHTRGAFAIGGMAAFIPNRRNPEINAAALEKVRQDKQREANDGFDGSWVAHPDLVPVATEVFDRALGDKPNQLHRERDDVEVSGQQLLDVSSTPGEITEQGLRNNVEVGIRYIESWLRGVGAAGINNLMEDVATAEISRSQVWQWVHNSARLSGEVVDSNLVRRMIDEELAKLRDVMGEQAYDAGRFKEAREVFEQVALADEFIDFLTLPAYDLLD
jgi:malate synthase